MRNGAFERRRPAAPRTLLGLCWGAVLAVAGAPSAGAQLPVPTGAQFQVNTYTTNFQEFPSIAADADGDFVVVWMSDGSSGGDTSNYSIQGQRYNSAGSAVGSQFQVNTYTTNYQDFPWVAADADGDFVVVWQSFGSSGSDTSYHSVQGQRFTIAAPAIPVPALGYRGLALLAVLLLLAPAWIGLRGAVSRVRR